MTDADLRDPGRTATAATYADYVSALRAVDLRSDNRFPAGNMSIVGEDVRLVARRHARTSVREH
jgi:Heat induced stress protein YflT domain